MNLLDSNHLPSIRIIKPALYLQVDSIGKDKVGLVLTFQNVRKMNCLVFVLDPVMQEEFGDPFL
jgi:hypothetical protein